MLRVRKVIQEISQDTEMEIFKFILTMDDVNKRKVLSLICYCKAERVSCNSIYSNEIEHTLLETNDLSWWHSYHFLLPCRTNYTKLSLTTYLLNLTTQEPNWVFPVLAGRRGVRSVIHLQQTLILLFEPSQVRTARQNVGLRRDDDIWYSEDRRPSHQWSSRKRKKTIFICFYWTFS